MDRIGGKRSDAGRTNFSEDSHANRNQIDEAQREHEDAATAPGTSISALTPEDPGNLHEGPGNLPSVQTFNADVPQLPPHPQQQYFQPELHLNPIPTRPLPEHPVQVKWRVRPIPTHESLPDQSSLQNHFKLNAKPKKETQIRPRTQKPWHKFQDDLPLAKQTTNRKRKPQSQGGEPPPQAPDFIHRPPDPDRPPTAAQEPQPVIETPVQPTQPHLTGSDDNSQDRQRPSGNESRQRPFRPWEDDAQRPGVEEPPWRPFRPWEDG